MQTRADLKPVNRGGVIGLGLGRFVFVGGGVALMLAANCLAGPENARVAAGKATIRQRGDTTVIRASDRSIIDYSRFNISRNETVRFIQPGADSTVLNRIHSQRPTVIDGTLTANGRVYMVNPGGILFTGNAVVQTNGLVAAAGTISNRDFLAGNDHFTNVRGDVINQGRIETGSAAALIGRHVSNSGTITAGGANGIVAMVAGEDVTLMPQGDTMSIRVARDAASTGVVDASRPGVENTGRVNAPRGRSLMLANDIYSLAAKNTGTVRAREISIESRGGGDVEVSGQLDAAGRGINGKGGTIEVTGERVLVREATLDARGAAGGGDIRVGGDQLGQGTLRHADATAIDANSRLLADANRAGDGGSVVVWSDGPTRVHGEVSASGGAQSGDGGFVETSGHGVDISGAKVEAGSPSGGVAGKWLLDPFNVTIDNSDGTPSGSPPMLDPFTPIADTTIDADDIAAALATTPVEITTGGAGGTPTDGNITVANTGAITYTGPGAATLTLRAANDITVNAGITTTGGALTVNLLANDSSGGNIDNDTAVGQVAINNGGGNLGMIATSNGAVTMTGVDVDLSGAGATVDAGSGDIVIRANSSANQDIGLGAAAAGTLTLNQAEMQQLASSGRVTVDSATDLVASSVTVTTLNLGAENYNLTIGGEDLTAANITLNTGKDLDLTGRTGTVAVTGTLDVMNGTITLRGDDVDVGGGAVSIDAGNGTVHYAANAGREVELGTGAGTGFRLSDAEIDNTTAGTIEVRSDGPATDDIAVGTISVAGATNLRLVTSGNIDEATANNTTDITLGTGTLILRAGNGVGDPGTDDGTGNGPLDINVDKLDVQATGVGSIYIKNTGALTVENAITTDGRISIRTVGGPGANMIVQNVGATQSMPSARTLELVADGDLTSMPVAMSDMVASNGNAYFESSNANDNITINNADVGSTPGSTVSLVTTGTGDATLTNVRDTVIAQADVGDDLSVTSSGNITQTAALDVGGDAAFKTLNNTGASITLDNVGNVVGGSLTALVHDAADGPATNGAVTIYEATTGADPMDVTKVETLGAVTLRADRMAIDTIGAGDAISSGAAAIRLEPLTLNGTIGLGTGGGTLSLSQAELRELGTTGTVTIGRDGGSGAIAINNAGNLDLTMVPYSLTLRGGDIAFAETVRLGGPASMNRQFTLFGEDITSSLALGTPAFIVDGTNGRALLDVTGDVTVAGSVDQIAARLQTAAKSIDYINVSSPLEIISLDGINGIGAASNGNITLRSGQTVTISSGVVTSGTGGVNIDTTVTGNIIDNTGAMGTAITVGPAGNIGLSTVFGRVGGPMAGDPLKINTGAASGGNFARLSVLGDMGLNIENAGTGELRATLTTNAGAARLRHQGALTTGGSDWVADSFDVETTGDFTNRDLAAGTPDEITAPGNVTIRSSGGAMTIVDRVRSTMTGDVTLRSAGNMVINPAAMMPAVSANTGNVAITSDNGLIDVNAEIRTVVDGNISLTSGANMAIDDMLEATMGDIALTAVGDIAINDIVKTNPGNVTITAGDLTFGAVGQVNAMAMAGTGGAVTIARSSEGIIDVGVAGASPAPGMLPVMLVDNGELGKITATALTIGDAGNTRLIRVADVLKPMADPSGMDDTLKAHDNLGSVTLRAERDTGTITFGGSRTSYFTTLDARAGAGIKVEQNITTTTGALALDADFNGMDVPSMSTGMVLGVDTDKIDVLHFSGARTLTTRAMSTTADVSLKGRRGNPPPSSGAPVTGILASDSLTITSKHDIDIAQNIDVAQTLTLNADNEVRLAGGGNGRTLNIQAQEGIRFTGNITIGTGGLSVDADSDHDGGVFSLTLDSMMRGTLTLGSGSALRISASDVNIAGNIAGAGSDVQIGRSSAGDINVGNFTDMAGILTVDNGELSRIACTNLTIGNFRSTTPAPTVTNTNTNAITVNGVTAMASDGVTGSFTLDAGTTLSFTGAGSTFRSLEGRAVGDLTVDASAPLTTTMGEMRLLADHATVDMTASDGMGNLIINGAILTNGRSFAGSGADFRLGANLNTGESSGAGPGRGDVSITRSSGGSILVADTPADSATRLSISDAELQRITCQNLVIGDASGVSSVTVRSVSDADGAGVAGETRFLSDGTIVFENASRFGELAASADKGIMVNGDLTTTRGNLSLDGNADMSDAGGDNTIEFSGNRTLDSAKDLTLSVQGGMILNTSGGLTLKADDNITINDSMTVSGALAVTADDEATSDGTGTITIASSDSERTTIISDTSTVTMTGVAFNLGASAAIVTGMGDITIHASAMDLAAGSRLNTSRNVNLSRSSAGRIGLGSVSDTSGLVLDRNELARITAAGDLIIGDANATRIDVQGVQNSDVASVTGALKLRALATSGDGGVIEFKGTAAQQFGTLEASARTQVRTRGNLSAIRGGITLDGGAETASTTDGTIILGGNLLTTTASGAAADVILNGAVELRKDITVTSQRDAKFSSTVRSPNRRNLLTVNAPRETVFGGDLGRANGAKLYGLSINPQTTQQPVARPNAVTKLGGNVYTSVDNNTRSESGIRFRDPVTITRNVTIVDDGPNGVFFHKSVTPQHTGSQRESLSVTVRSSGPTPVTFSDVKPIPVIAFGGDVGTDLRPFKSITLNGAGHTNVQALPTIVASRFGRVVSSTQTTEDDFAAVPTGTGPTFDMVATDSFTVGPNEKLTALGGLDISVTGSGGVAKVGDLTALNDINVAASRIEILGRPNGPIFDAGSRPNTRLAIDSGTDFVAGGSIRFSTPPQAPSNQAISPTFGSPNPRPANANLDSFLYRTFDTGGVPFRSTLTRTVTTGSTTQTFITDLEPNGPSDTNFADSIAGFIPRESRVNDVGQDTVISQALFSKLQQLGVNPRNLTGDERLAALTGWSTYDDFPVSQLVLVDKSLPVQTTVNRLPDRRTNELVDKFNALFFATQVDPETKQTTSVDQRPVIKAAFTDAAKKHRAATGAATGRIEPRALRQWVDANDLTAKGYADRLGEILDDLRLLGLVGKELSEAKRQLLINIRPSSVGNWSIADTENFIHLPVQEREPAPEAGM